MTKGQRFTLNGHSWKVVYVNASRAHCVCLDTQQVTIGNRSFTAHSTRTMDISPSSAVDVYQELTASPRRVQ